MLSSAALGFIVFGLGRISGFGFGGSFGFRFSSGAGFLLGSDRSDFVVARQRRDFVDGRVIDQAGRRDFRLRRSAGSWRPGRPDKERCRGAATLTASSTVSQPPFVTRNRALDEQQAAERVGADDFKVLLGAIARAHVTGHLLVLEHAAWILAVAGRAVRTVRDRNAVGRAQALKAPALHARRQSPCPA